MPLDTPLKDIVVIYHAHCQDGFGSAFAAYRKFGNTASYLPCSDRVTPPFGLINKELYILDFSFSKPVLLDLELKNKKLVVIDHHISEKEAVTSIKNHVFDNEHSASFLSWQYFTDTPATTLIKMLEIIDLAKDKEHHHADVITYILSKPFKFEDYEQLSKDLDNPKELAKIKELGKAQNNYLQVIISTLIENPDFVIFEGYTIPCINIFLPINEKSIVLTELYNKYPPFAMSYRFDDGFIKVSLRGNDAVNLMELARKYGGGGHKNSAGFVVPVEFPLPFAKIIKKNS